jgi:hypothetical protein
MTLDLKTRRYREVRWIRVVERYWEENPMHEITTEAAPPICIFPEFLHHMLLREA